MEVMKSRRTLLKSTLTIALGGIGLLSGLLKPVAALAAWNQKALESTKVMEGLQAAYGDTPVTLSDQVTLKAPEIAENGSSVPITIETNLPDVETIALFSEENPRPFAAMFHPGPGVRAKVLLRIKMAKTGDAIAVVKSQGKLHMARLKVKVTAGGCGG